MQKKSILALSAVALVSVVSCGKITDKVMTISDVKTIITSDDVKALDKNAVIAIEGGVIDFKESKLVCADLTFAGLTGATVTCLDKQIVVTKTADKDAAVSGTEITATVKDTPTSTDAKKYGKKTLKFKFSFKA